MNSDNLNMKNKKALLAFMLVLFLFLLLINVLVVSQFRTIMKDSQTTEEDHETELFTNFVTSLVVKRDYSRIEDLVKDWGTSRSNVVNIKVLAGNKYVVAEYKADYSIHIPSVVRSRINVSDSKKYYLSITYDRIKLEEELKGVTNNLILISILIFIFLSAALWKILVKTALLPLQREALRHKKISKELYLAKKEAERANKTKSEFLANMSHEIRTPMNGIMGMLHLIKETELTKEQQDCVNTADTSAKTLLVIINDILDFSKIEAGKLTLEKADFDLHEVVANVGALFSEVAFRKKIELAIDIDMDVPVFVQGDPTRVGQIITNLMSNAIKFTDKGEIVVNVKVEEKGSAKTMLCFEIKDTGIGISKEAQERIFQGFSQADTSTTRHFGGTGLGLSISKQLAELMGGSIGVTSKKGEGSNFWFTIVVNDSSLDDESTSEDLSFKNKRVLVVDDNKTNCKILNKQLTSWSIEHDIVSNGVDALDKFDKSISDDAAYSVVLLDMMMPEMDGIEVAKQLNKSPSAPDIIMLSSGNSNDVNLALENKIINSYLLKPVRSSVLFDTLSAVMSGQQPAEKNLSSEDSFAEKIHSDKTVLVVEDNKINQRVIVGLLNKLGVTADIANNGIEGIEKINSRKYDLVFMDCQMPEMDGYTATKNIRESEKDDEHVNIIAMTANAMEGDKEVCLAAGMDDYISKPIKPVVLKEFIAEWL